MKKKTISFLILAILLVCTIIYFRPLSLSDLATEDSLINIIFNEYVVKNGTPDINTVEYTDITTEQKNTLLPVLEKYTYRRTFGTLFSNGSISGTGNKMLSIYVFDDNSDNIFVTALGKIAVNNKNYHMENSGQFIEQIIEIMAQTK